MKMRLGFKIESKTTLVHLKCKLGRLLSLLLLLLRSIREPGRLLVQKPQICTPQESVKETNDLEEVEFFLQKIIVSSKR